MQSKFQIKSIGIDLGKTTFHLIALGTRAQVSEKDYFPVIWRNLGLPDLKFPASVQVS